MLRLAVPVIARRLMFLRMDSSEVRQATSVFMARAVIDETLRSLTPTPSAHARMPMALRINISGKVARVLMSLQDQARGFHSVAWISTQVRFSNDLRVASATAWASAP